jgi:hypothetical protein
LRKDSGFVVHRSVLEAENETGHHPISWTCPVNLKEHSGKKSAIVINGQHAALDAKPD